MGITHKESNANLDELDESNEQSPRMWSVNDESLHQHASDLLLDNFLRGLLEQEEEHAAVVVRVAVRIAQLVRNRVEEQVATLRIEIDRQETEELHGRLQVELGGGKSNLKQIPRADVEYQGVDQRQVVATVREASANENFIQESRGLLPRGRLEILVKALFQREVRRLGENVGEVGAETRELGDLGQQVNLEIWSERIG